MVVVKCPQCGRSTEFEGNEYRPFCSERCRILDLGAWAEGKYRVPAEEKVGEEEAELIELARQQDEDS
ncbi:MAG: DNA gyrase inhibitor YacG [Acidobacteriota bacterium]